MSRIIDSHIHLFDKVHLNELAWMTDDGPLNDGDGQDLVRYAEETDKRVQGVIFIETDRKVGKPMDNVDSWNYVFNEYEYIDRIWRKSLLPIERNDPLPDIPILAAIPWAPVPEGPIVLEKYISQLKSKGKNFHLVKGFRYLVQDKPKGTLLKENFIKGVEYLGQNGFIFELGIDIRSGGLWQLKEAIEFSRKVPNCVLIINHLTKPNLYLSPENIEKNEEFQEWKQLIHQLHDCSNSFIKLSGGFSELPKESFNDIDLCVRYILPWFKVAFELWGIEKVVWGSDWPVCKIGGGNIAITRWIDICDKLLNAMGINDKGKDLILYKNSLKAYNISIH